jgi:hypothetical protein
MPGAMRFRRESDCAKVDGDRVGDEMTRGGVPEEGR